MAHKVFIIFLFFIGLTAAMAVGIHGLSYYLAPVPQRPFLSGYAQMKPSGYFSHALGIFGATMITVGVVSYSSRKRIRALWSLGRLSLWLEVHIFLCLLGPVLVVYHSTFKAGGIAAISLWTMLAVAASGVIGRFLYVLIPRNMKGSELTSNQINEEFERLGTTLSESPIGANLVKSIDENFATIKRPETLGETFATYIRLMGIKRRVRRAVHILLAKSHLPHRMTRKLSKAASARASLIQRSILLLQAEKLFFYWHAIHLPFSIMMFVTLAAHIGVAIWLGYHWIF